MAASTTSNRRNYDANLGDILEDMKTIDAFLDVVFEFLYRRTDFYRIMQNENDTMGLPSGISKKFVMQAYMKYATIMQHTHAGQCTTANKHIKEREIPVAEAVVEVSCSQPVEDKQSNVTTGSTSTIPQKDCAMQLKKKEGVSPKNEKVKIPKTLRKREITTADTYNGGEGDGYCWSQTLADIDLKIFVPDSLKKGKDVDVVIKNNSITVCSKHVGERDIFINRKLVNEVYSDDCMWSLHPGCYVQLSLEKKVQSWWKSVFVGEREIDQKSIDNTMNIHEMDAESQADYNRVMFDMDQKRKGKPSSKELEAHEMLKQAWNAEGSPFEGTAYDPSVVDIST